MFPRRLTPLQTLARTGRYGAIAALVALCSPSEALAAAWPEPVRSIRLGLGYAGTDSRRQFAPGDAGGLVGPLCPEAVEGGDRMPFSCATGGRYTQHALRAEVSLGPLPFLSVDVAVPIVLRASFSDHRGTTAVSGVGDLRIGVRVGREDDGWAVSGGLSATVPTGPSGLRDREVPLGEGHWEIEPSIHAGRSLWPWGWIEAGTGLRVRLPAANVNVDRGEEWIASLSGGFTPIRFVGITARLESIVAGPDRDSFGLTSPGRALLALSPGLVVFPVPDLWISGEVTFPLAGLEWPAGPALSVKVAGRIRLPDHPPQRGV